MTKRLALLAAHLLALTACGSGSGDAAPSSSSSSSTGDAKSSGAATPSSDTAATSNPLGTEATVSDNGSTSYTVTALAYEPKVGVPYSDQAFLGLKTGEHWSRLKAKVCPTHTVQVNWFMFSAIDSEGGTYKGIDQSFHDPFPGPLLPDEINGIAPGPCRTGWLYIPITDGADVTTLSFQDGNASVNWAAK